MVYPSLGKLFITASLLGSLLHTLPSAKHSIFATAMDTSSSDNLAKRSLSQRDSSTGQVHLVTVGQNGFMYQPNNISANVGDTISFQFYPSNHSVVRGVYCGDTEGGACNPCVPIELLQNGTTGFSSQNFVTDQDPTPQNLQFQTYNLTINDTNPIWFYCTAIDSCNKLGMVGVINGAPSSSIDRQIAIAKTAPFELSPGQSLPGLSSASPTPSPSSSHSSSLSGGAIAGIAIAGVFVIALGLALFYFVGRNKANKKNPQRGQTLPKTEYTSPSLGESTPNMQHNSFYRPPTWSPHPQISPNQPGQTFEGQYQYSYHPNGDLQSSIQGPGTFLGYNRLTGIAEFAQEAPTGNEIEQTSAHYHSLHEKRGLTPFSDSGLGSEGHGEMHELPVQHPEIAEMGQVTDD